MDEKGREGLLALKRNNHNLFLQELVLNTSSSHMYRVTDHVIVPRLGPFTWSRFHKMAGRLLQPPENPGKWKIPALWYNLSVLGLMAVLTSLALFLKYLQGFCERKTYIPCFYICTIIPEILFNIQKN